MQLAKPKINCSICDKPVEIESAKTDEFGSAYTKNATYSRFVSTQTHTRCISQKKCSPDDKIGCLTIRLRRSLPDPHDAVR